MKETGKDAARSIPKGLTIAFTVHCIVDVLFALPLFVLPESFLGLLGWKHIDPIAARLVAAALFGIGIESFIGRNAAIDSFRGMLNLKIIWSSAAVAGFVISLITYEDARLFFVWMLVVVFLLFNLMWVYWRVKLEKLRPCTVSKDA